MIKLSLSEIQEITLPRGIHIKVFCLSLIMIPLAFVTHIFTAGIQMFSIPNRVVDIISLSEKTKIAIRKKQNEKTITP